jgi:hypothetical protein
MTDNQIQIGFEVDNNALQSGLSDSSQQVAQVAQEIQENLAGIGTAAAGAGQSLKTLADEKGSLKEIDDRFAQQTAEIAILKDSYKESADEAISQQIRIEEARYAAIRSELNKENQAQSASAQVRQQLQNKADAEEVKHDAKMRALEQQRVKESEASWMSILSPIGNAFQSSLNGIIRGNETLRQATAKMGQAVISDFVGMAVKRATNWIASELTMTEATEAGNAIRSASDAAGASSGILDMLGKAIESITVSAAETGAGVAAFMAPEIGPAAVPAGETAELTVLSFIPGLSAAGGVWNLPTDMLVQAHAKESILPAAIAAPMRDFFQNGGAAGSTGGTAGGDTHINVNVQAVDAQSVQRLFMNNGGALVKALSGQLRLLNVPG